MIYAYGFKTTKKTDGWYATQCYEDGTEPETAHQVGPCVSEKQAAWLYPRYFGK